jgi:hypothetical protein
MRPIPWGEIVEYGAIVDVGFLYRTNLFDGNGFFNNIGREPTFGLAPESRRWCNLVPLQRIERAGDRSRHLQHVGITLLGQWVIVGLK